MTKIVIIPCFFIGIRWFGVFSRSFWLWQISLWSVPGFVLSVFRGEPWPPKCAASHMKKRLCLLTVYGFGCFNNCDVADLSWEFEHCFSDVTLLLFTDQLENWCVKYGKTAGGNSFIYAFVIAMLYVRLGYSSSTWAFHWDLHLNVVLNLTSKNGIVAPNEISWSNIYSALNLFKCDSHCLFSQQSIFQRCCKKKSLYCVAKLCRTAYGELLNQTNVWKYCRG